MKLLLSGTLLVCLLPFISMGNLNRQSGNKADTTERKSMSDLINLYYDLKDALVNSDASAAAEKARLLLDAVSNADIKSLSANDAKEFTAIQPKLAYDARHISEVKAIDHQREHFASLSANMFKLAKVVKLSATPVYKMYCPMKKAYWLSNETTVRNPYYGQQMLSCGKVEETIK